MPPVPIFNGSAYNFFQKFNSFEVNALVTGTPVAQPVVSPSSDIAPRFGVSLLAHGKKFTLACEGTNCGGLWPNAEVTLLCAKEWQGWTRPAMLVCVVARFPHN